MDELKARWTSLSLPRKLLTILFIPLAIALLLLRATGLVSSWLNSRQRAETDKKSDELDKKKADIDKQIAKEEGKIEQINEERKDALEDAKHETPTDFFNRRYRDPNKK